MDLQAFARNIVDAAKMNGSIRILPISQRDREKNCIIRFSMGSGTVAVDTK
jgi:hypothetical protein